jgi:hypothetical protein
LQNNGYHAGGERGKQKVERPFQCGINGGIVGGKKTAGDDPASRDRRPPGLQW